MRRLIVGILLAVAGCADPQGGSAAPSTTVTRPSTEAVAWMEDLCAVAADLRADLWGSANGTGTLRERLRHQLDTAAVSVAAAVDRLSALSVGPVHGGQEAVTDLVDRLAELEQSLRTGHDELNALPAEAGEAELGQVLGTVWPRAATRAGEPFADVPLTDQMRAAATGPTCAALDLDR